MGELNVQDIKGVEMETTINYIPTTETIVIRMNNQVTKMSKEQYIEHNKKNGEFIKSIVFEIPAMAGGVE